MKFGASSIACISRSAAAGKIALQLQIARKFEPAVGHQIAGGEKQAGRHGFRNFVIAGLEPWQSIKNRRFSEMDAQVKPAHDG